MDNVLLCPKCQKNASENGVKMDPIMTLQMDPETLMWNCPENHVFSPEEITDIMTHLAEEKLALLDAPATASVQASASLKGEKAATKPAKTSHARDAKTPEKQGKKTPEKPVPAVPESGNDVDLKKAGDHEVFRDYTPSAGSELAFVVLENGDLLVTVRIREMYAESAAGLADENKQTVTEWVQERLDFYMENEFAMVKTV